MSQTVTLGITSGIAAFKILELITQLQHQQLNVKVIMTESAVAMLPPAEVAAVTGQLPETQLFSSDFDYHQVLAERSVNHIELADHTDVLVIAPATANTLAKLATGMADNLLTTVALAVTAPIIVCPSMNVNMWHHPTVQHNLQLLRQAGYIIIEPATGMLACGYEGQGRLAEISIIFDEIIRQLKRTQSLRGKKIVITAGGTQEKIDDVRFITNRSSGKMGAALADACYLRGAEVVLLRAQSAVEPRYVMTQKTFTTAAELLNLVQTETSSADIFFHAAAVSDFTVAEPVTGKITSHQPLTLTLMPQPKILSQIKTLNPRVKLIAFKAEHHLTETELIQIAQEKMVESQAEAVIANDISRSDRGFEADTNEVWIIPAGGQPHKINLTTKQRLAEKILDYLEPLLDKKIPLG